MAQTLNATDDVSCPGAAILLTGTEAAPSDSEVAAWSDGYRAEFDVTLGAMSISSEAGMAGMCFGANLTKSSAPNGAYCLTWNVAADQTGALLARREADDDITASFYTTDVWEAFSLNVWVTTGQYVMNNVLKYDMDI